MRCESGETESGCVLFHYVPDYPFCYAVTPVFAGSTDTSEQSSGRDFSCSNPQVDRRFGPVGHRYGSNVPAFADEIYYSPMFLPLLQMRELEIGQFAAPQSAPKQDGENRPVPFTFERGRVRCLPESTGFLNREPISKPHTQLLSPLHASDASGELRAEQPSVGSLIRKPSYCGEPSIDRARREPTILQENAVTGYDDLAETTVAARSSTTE